MTAGTFLHRYESRRVGQGPRGWTPRSGARKYAAPVGSAAGATPSYFWTVMSQNGNAPASLGSDDACVPQCYHQADEDRPAGWPPAVNASAALCPAGRPHEIASPSTRRRLFNNQPMNQAKTLIRYTDLTSLRGGFNWTCALIAIAGHIVSRRGQHLPYMAGMTSTRTSRFRRPPSPRTRASACGSGGTMRSRLGDTISLGVCAWWHGSPVSSPASHLHLRSISHLPYMEGTTRRSRRE